MRIGIEVSAAVTGRRTGVGHYVANLVGALQERGDHTLVLLSNRFDPRAALDGVPLAPENIYPHHRFPSRLPWMQAALPRSIARIHPDVCHFPNHIGPITGTGGQPVVVTIHDMSVYRHPEFHRPKTVAVHRALLPLLVRRQCVIVTVSAAARQDVLAYLDVPEERVHVVHEGVHRDFTPVAQQYDGEILAAHGIAHPYVLSVGTLEPRKNGARLIEAFARLVREQRIPHHLVMVGAPGWKDATLRARIAALVPERIHVLGYVPTAHLAALYRSAAAFAFPSLYEGFGLPVLEALACGTPTLISRDLALHEVAGEAAVRVRAGEVDDIAAGLLQLLTDDDLCRQLRRSGPPRAAQFTWERTADQTIHVYRRAVELAAPRLYTRAPAY